MYRMHYNIIHIQTKHILMTKQEAVNTDCF